MGVRVRARPVVQRWRTVRLLLLAALLLPRFLPHTAEAAKVERLKITSSSLSPTLTAFEDAGGAPGAGVLLLNVAPSGGGLLDVLAPSVPPSAASACQAQGGKVAFSVAPSSPKSKRLPIAVDANNSAWAIGPLKAPPGKQGVKAPFTLTAECLNPSGQPASASVAKGTKKGRVTLTMKTCTPAQKAFPTACRTVVAGSQTDTVTASDPGLFDATIPPAALPPGATMSFEGRPGRDVVDANSLAFAAILSGRTPDRALRVMPSGKPNKAISVALTWGSNGSAAAPTTMSLSGQSLSTDGYGFTLVEAAQLKMSLSGRGIRVGWDVDTFIDSDLFGKCSSTCHYVSGRYPGDPPRSQCEPVGAPTATCRVVIDQGQPENDPASFGLLPGDFDEQSPVMFGETPSGSGPPGGGRRRRLQAAPSAPTHPQPPAARRRLAAAGVCAGGPLLAPIQDPAAVESVDPFGSASGRDGIAIRVSRGVKVRTAQAGIANWFQGDGGCYAVLRGYLGTTIYGGLDCNAGLEPAMKTRVKAGTVMATVGAGGALLFSYIPEVLFFNTPIPGNTVDPQPCLGTSLAVGPEALRTCDPAVQPAIPQAAQSLVVLVREGRSVPLVSVPFCMPADGPAALSADVTNPAECGASVALAWGGAGEPAPRPARGQQVLLNLTVSVPALNASGPAVRNCTIKIVDATQPGAPALANMSVTVDLGVRYIKWDAKLKEGPCARSKTVGALKCGSKVALPALNQLANRNCEGSPKWWCANCTTAKLAGKEWNTPVYANASLADVVYLQFPVNEDLSETPVSC